jgi:hypothetical protein
MTINTHMISRTIYEPLGISLVLKPTLVHGTLVPWTNLEFSLAPIHGTLIYGYKSHYMHVRKQFLKGDEML